MKRYSGWVLGLLLLFQICIEQHSVAKCRCYEENISQQNKGIDSFAVLEQYNLIHKTIPLHNYFQVYDVEFPSLKYVPEWDGWVVIDSSLYPPESYSIIEDYLGESRFVLSYTNDYLKIENRQPVVSAPRVVIEVKTFSTKESRSIVGISYSYSSSASFSDEGYKFFEIKNDSIINDVTATIFEEPALQDFFANKKELKKFKEYSCIKPSIAFQKDSENFIMSTVFTCENECDNGNKKYKKMCSAYENLKKIDYKYTFNEATGRFVLAE